MDERRVECEKLKMSNHDLTQGAQGLSLNHESERVRIQNEYLVLNAQKEKVESLAEKMEEKFKDSEVLIEKLVFIFS